MLNTALSPRLRHLLILEDSRTGKLIRPVVNCSSEGGVSPPLSPDYATSSGKPPLSADSLPAPQFSDDRRPSQIFSLLNDLSVASPRSTPYSPGPGSISTPTIPRSPSPGYAQTPLPTPLSVPLPGKQPLAPFGVERRPITQGPISPRPELSKRHSPHPYEHNSASQPAVYRHVDYTPSGLGTSRTPISRTTKACDACRARKVRCEAGGHTEGECSTCLRCRESGVPCVYSAVQKKRGPCPGTTHRTIAARRRLLQRGVAVIYPPEPTQKYHPYSSRLSFGFAPPQAYSPLPHPHRQPTPAHSAGPFQTARPTMQLPPHARPYDGRPPSQTGPEMSACYSSNPLQHKHSQLQSVLSWPHMEPAKPVVYRLVPFDADYSTPSPSTEDYSGAGLSREKARQLPPLRKTIGSRPSY